jgi:aryl-alcohol dehydrogenase-like predicted oxidoreductase
VQNQFSPAFRTSEPELRLCEELGIAFLPWSPLGGIGGTGQLDPAHAPFQQLAQSIGVSRQQVILAWMLTLSPTVIPIPGASRPETIRDSAAATELRLTPDQLAHLNGNPISVK